MMKQEADLDSEKQIYLTCGNTKFLSFSYSRQS